MNNEHAAIALEERASFSDNAEFSDSGEKLKRPLCGRFVPQAVAYLEECKKQSGGDRYANVLRVPVADALISFCEQDGEFAQAVAQTKDFDKCLAAVSKGAGGCLSDLEAYSRAASFYFPGAKVNFQMTIDLIGDVAKPEEKENPKRLALSLEDIL